MLAPTDPPGLIWKAARFRFFGVKTLTERSYAAMDRGVFAKQFPVALNAANSANVMIVVLTTGRANGK
jgi:hypothetical protein